MSPSKKGQSMMGMGKKIIENPYTYFLISILLVFIIEPIMAQVSHPVFPLLHFIFVFVIITVFWSLKLKKKYFVPCVVLALAAFALELVHVVLRSRGAVVNLEGIVISTYALFILLAIVIFIVKIFSTETVTLDTIRGGLSIYILFGFFWALLYQAFLIADPNSISVQQEAYSFSNLLYYSFTTLTTLGYGDIVPINPLVRNVAVLEAVIGQLFLATFIARLIGLHLSHQRD